MSSQEELKDLRLDELKAIVVDIAGCADAGPAQVDPWSNPQVGSKGPNIVVGAGVLKLLQAVW
ncbi:MAG: hypothetical protein AB3N64_04415, partial [Puniceicoccaceae bacterium]